jgi:hypothetical protein
MYSLFRLVLCVPVDRESMEDKQQLGDGKAIFVSVIALPTVCGALRSRLS